MKPRYLLDGRRSITCLRCGRTSYNPNDIKERYCGWCHIFLDDNTPEENQQLKEALVMKDQPIDPRAQLKSRKIYIFSLIENGRLKMAQEEMKHYLEIKIKIAEEDLRNFIDETQDKL